MYRQPDGKTVGFGDTSQDFYKTIGEESSESLELSEPVFSQNTTSYSQKDIEMEPESAAQLLPKLTDDTNKPNIHIDQTSTISSLRSMNRSKPRGATKPRQEFEKKTRKTKSLNFNTIISNSLSVTKARQL